MLCPAACSIVISTSNDHLTLASRQEVTLHANRLRVQSPVYLSCGFATPFSFTPVQVVDPI